MTREAPDISQQAHDILDQLKIDQIKFLFRKLDKDFPSKAKKEELIEALLSSGRNTKKIREEACRLASESPTKHVFIAGIDNPPSKLPQFKEVFEAQALKKFEILFVDKSDDEIVIACQHFISTERWVKESRTRKIMKMVSFNHLNFIRVNLKERLVLVLYNGFENKISSRDPNYVSYQAIVEELLRLVYENLGIKTTALPIRTTIEFLVENGSSRLSLQKLNPDFGIGKLIVSSQEGLDVQSLLAKIFGGNQNRDVFNKQVLNSFKNSSVEYFVTHWKDEDVFSRIEFWTFGSEFLFIWKGRHPNLSDYMSIFSFMTKTSEKDLMDNSSILSIVKNKNAGEIIRVTDVSGAVSQSTESIKKELTEFVNMGLLDLVYKVKTDENLTDHMNEWTNDLLSLRRVFHTATGYEIDGKNPKNVEVAFQKPAAPVFENIIHVP